MERKNQLDLNLFVLGRLMHGPSKYGQLRFCPKCGLERLKRDYFPTNDPPGAFAPKEMKHPANGCEYLCENCGFSFVIAKSRREHFADRLHKEHRKLRAGVTFNTKCVGEDVARAYNESTGK